MGLAAYGEPEQLEAFRDILRYDAKEGGYDFQLALKYFIHHNKNIRITYRASGKTAGRRRFYSDEMVRRLARRAPRRSLLRTGIAIWRRRFRRASKRYT
jgi:hypothetical protein